MLSFRVTAQDGAARRGVISTAHGEMETPGFFAVATQAALKGLDPEAAGRAGVGAVIANAYHLHLQPGGEAVERAEAWAVRYAQNMNPTRIPLSDDG